MLVTGARSRCDFPVPNHGKYEFIADNITYIYIH